MGDRDRDNADWGRLPGAAPPLPASAPLLTWLLLAVVLTTTVIGVVGGPGPLDDPNQGDQRPGFLIDPKEARVVGGLNLPGNPIGRRPVFIAFDRNVPRPDELRRAVREVPDRYAVFLVVPGPPPVAGTARAEIVADARGRVADAVGLDRPKDGGAPIGYAVIDSGGRVRYATIDPTWTRHGFEIDRITRALR